MLFEWNDTKSHRKTYQVGDCLNQLLSIPMTTGVWLSSDVDKIPRIVVILPEDPVLRLMESGKEFGEEAGLAFLGQFPAEEEEPTADHCPDIVHVLTWGHPSRHMLVIIT